MNSALAQPAPRRVSAAVAASADVADRAEQSADRAPALRHDRPERVLSTLNHDGSRRWLRPRLSGGRFLKMRRLVAYALIAIFTFIPYLRVGGQPAILLDLAARRFHVFGATFLPTDTLLLALLLVGIFVLVFLVTALLGRVWCGWACPQTVYMEFVFRPIERLFDGSPGRRNLVRFRGSGLATALKYLTFLAVSLCLAHTFLAYFVGVEKLAQWVQRSPFEHPAGFLVMAATTALMMFDFCVFREQTCIVACPYGRLQSVMLDRDSLIIIYDAQRGEPRGKKRSRHQGINTSGEPTRAGGTAVGASMPLPLMPSSRGDCVDCSMCVTTCPTGIDIRDGLQMECIGCAQCIDACDAVMDKISRPRGLIRYSSQRAMSGEPTHMLRPRVVVYPLILCVIAGLFAMALVNRGAANVTVLRGLGSTFTQLSSAEVANHARVKIVNRIDAPHHFTIAVEGVAGARIETEHNPVTLAGGESRTVPVMIIVPTIAFTQGKCSVSVVVSDGTAFVHRTSYQLLGPGSMRHTGHQVAGKAHAQEHKP